MNKNIPIIFRILKKNKNKSKRPFVSEWAEVVKDPFTTLISCMLSLRTKDETTAKASLRLLKRCNTPEKILRLNTKEIEKLIYPVGFYRTKARRIKEISGVLLKKYNGNVPNEFNKLMELKGVGRKTANIVMTYGFNKKDYLPIDIHCHRIPNRLGWIRTKTPEETEDELKKILPKKYWHDFNDLFVQFGQNICRPVKPRCDICPINRYCKYYLDKFLNN